jgi:hypothetical protein
MEQLLANTSDVQIYMCIPRKWECVPPVDLWVFSCRDCNDKPSESGIGPFEHPAKGCSGQEKRVGRPTSLPILVPTDKRIAPGEAIEITTKHLGSEKW